MIVTSFSIVSAISIGFGLGMNLVFGLSSLGAGVLAFIAQIGGYLFYDKVVEYNLLKSAIDDFKSKPYKEYNIPLSCQYCGKAENINVDLNETIYECSNCKRKNGIHVTFMTTAMN